MKSKKSIVSLFIGLGVIVLSTSSIVQGPGTYAWTGSPVDGGPGAGGQCSYCHNGGATVPTDSITFNPALGGGNTYMPSQIYTITISPVGSYPYYGTNCEIINSQSATTTSVAMFGAFGVAASSNVRIWTSSMTTPYPPCVSQNVPSASPFSFTWAAPTSGTGYLYADVNGVNGDATISGDHVSGVTMLTLTPAPMSVATLHNPAVAFSIFPNPAVDEIRLNYTLSARSQVSVKLISVAGAEVAELLHDVQDAGNCNHALHLPVGLNKGLYFARLELNGTPVSTCELLVN